VSIRPCLPRGRTRVICEEVIVIVTYIISNFIAQLTFLFICDFVPLCRGSVIAKIVATNVVGKNAYNETVVMHVHEEIVDGQKLSDIINLKHENVKYLPGCKLPENLVCTTVFCNLCHKSVH